MKWVAFMNFWLEYVHNTAKGTGYKMNSSARKIIGQMFIDDNSCGRAGLNTGIVLLPLDLS